MASKFDEKVLARMNEMAPLDFGKAGEIAEEFDLKVRSVVAAATRNGIAYNRKARVGKTGEPVVSKADLVKLIAEAIGLDETRLDTLDKANKTALSALADKLQK